MRPKSPADSIQTAQPGLTCTDSRGWRDPQELPVLAHFRIVSVAAGSAYLQTRRQRVPLQSCVSVDKGDVGYSRPWRSRLWNGVSRARPEGKTGNGSTMKHVIYCPQCGNSMTVELPTNLPGVECPHCNTRIALPSQLATGDVPPPPWRSSRYRPNPSAEPRARPSHRWLSVFAASSCLSPGSSWAS